MEELRCEKKDCTTAVSKVQADQSVGATGHILCSFHLHKRMRINAVLRTIIRYLKNGQSLNDVIQTTDITQNECIEGLDMIERALKKKP